MVLRWAPLVRSCTHWGFQPKAPSQPNLVWPNGASNIWNTGEGVTPDQDHITQWSPERQYSKRKQRRGLNL